MFSIFKNETSFVDGFDSDLKNDAHQPTKTCTLVTFAAKEQLIQRLSLFSVVDNCELYVTCVSQSYLEDLLVTL